ncbi:hypothetical protein Salat_1683100 [Sesamum alatum]|uniref:Myb/SANT-like domain-containing protein n=1 Tax=Sesamum alatum TaxID=300844 RepID=A0AAE2CJW7_9LAMI|nr:hypothetical protein Salat_1683100 [Sesamum alatum]
MSGDGHMWQQKLFYCEHWTPEIEDTFVQSLLAHHRKGSFHHDRMNCHAVLCALFDINARFGSTLSYSYCQRKLEKLKIRYRVFSWITSLVAVEWDPKTNHISADDYTWEQIAKVKSIGKAYVNAVEPQWTALWILFGEITTINDWDDEDVFFDRAGTCVDDGWVHNGNAPSDDTSYESPNNDTADNGNDDPSWWAFIQEYYASDSGTGSVNANPSTIRQPAPSGYCTPTKESPKMDAGTPSSCASNDPQYREDTPSPYVPKYLLRRQPKKPKF